ncbi:MAG TPA: hypothetical protein DCE41_06960 [Cytophagales bacterium]|nr:hypothetical protein [Cytophagales bacterium]HAA22046.1 hypothetical protein [Cytophagales bacterium]HAP58583.1 hypothetical protein [Cytophagales bacterium]
MIETSIQDQLKLTKAFNHAKVYSVIGTKVLVIEATREYIPIEEFKTVFAYVGEIVKQEKVAKLIFDKRALRIFHQPSMEWYFIDWKEEMWGYGLRTHRKLLPEDTIFRESVKIGREKIFRENPRLKAREMDIQYREDLVAAIED